MNGLSRTWFVAASALASSLVLESAWPQQTEPFVEIDVSPTEVPVGEPVTMRVSVYVPTWFAKPPVFPTFEIPNAITRLPPNSSRPTSRRVGRDTWTGITRNYQVFPLLGARFRLENQTLGVQYANPGSDPVRTSVDTGEIAFTAVVPAGAENLNPYVAGSRLEIARNIEGNISSIDVGDAIVMTYTAELDGLSAIFLPDLVKTHDMPGVSVYPEQPVVEDDPVARRTEQLTYIFNAGGNFEIPAVTIDWWNKDTAQIETASVPALPLTVTGPPLQTEPIEEPAARQDWWPVLAALVLLVLLRQRLKGRIASMRANIREREQQRRASEPYAWERARKALHKRDAHHAHDEIVRWLGKLAPGLDSRDFAAQYGDTALAEELATLNRALYAGSGDSPKLRKIAHRLSAARKRCLAERQSTLEAALPPLNP